MPHAVQAQPVVSGPSETRSNAMAKSDLAPLAPNHGTGQGILGTLPASSLASADPAPRTTASAPVARQVEAAKPAIRPGSWIIQVGALESEADAKTRLNEARDQARGVLGKAEPFTETVARGDKQLYRARFAGFVDRGRAEAACKTLKRSDVPCFAMKY